MGCVFSVNDQQLSLADIYSVNHLKHHNFAIWHFGYLTRQSCFMGALTNIISVDDDLLGLKLVEVWLGFPKVHCCSNG